MNCNLPQTCYAARDMVSKRTFQLPKGALERAGAWLEKGGLRPTRQRQALAALLVGDGADRHVTAESLHEESMKSDSAVSLATVYNTLRAFCEAGLLREVTVDGHKSYFDTRLDEHAHYYWEDSGRLTDAPSGSFRVGGFPKAPEGARIARVDVIVRLQRA